MQAESKLHMESGGVGAPVSSWSVLSLIWGESGLGGFWRGLLPALLLVVNPAVQYMLYEQLLRLLRRWKHERTLAARRKQQQQQASGQGDDGSAPLAPDESAGPAGAASGEGETTKLSALEIFLASAVAKIGATGMSSIPRTS